jgi:hypothetical protein
MNPALALVLIGGLWLGGCVTPAPLTPVEVVERALDTHRSEGEVSASVWLTSAAKRRGAGWVLEPAGADAVPKELKRRVRWAGSGREALELVSGPDGWKIRSGALLFMRSDSPDRALRKLARGVLGGDFALVLTLLPDSERRHWTPGGLAQLLQKPALKPAWVRLARAIEQGLYLMECFDSEERCQALVAGVSRVMLVRSGATWKVVDVQPRAQYSAPPPTRKRP